MSSLDVIHKLRQRLQATAAAKPNQWHTGVAMLRFLALMLLLTLLVRGTAATTLPVVSVTAPYQGVVTQSFTVSGQISPGIGTPLTIPEGLLVEQIFVQPGDPVTEGQTLALLSLDDVRAEIEQVQASMQQHQVQANQLLAGRPIRLPGSRRSNSWIERMQTINRQQRKARRMFRRHRMCWMRPTRFWQR